ncbi:MAG: hypothetical protein EXR39_01795 [Betaproteobacteria bacterium]|nr:hypothetical protein [Betaproteobacteria bacterium]
MLGLLLASSPVCSNATSFLDGLRDDSKSYPTVGLIEFASNADATISEGATRRFRRHLEATRPDIRFLEIGTCEDVLAAIDATELDTDAIRKIGELWGLVAVFIGDINHSDSKPSLGKRQIDRQPPSVNPEVKGDIAARLIETQHGREIWRSASWVKKRPTSVRVAMGAGGSGVLPQSDPRGQMVPALVYLLTQYFRADDGIGNDPKNALTAPQE